MATSVEISYDDFRRLLLLDEEENGYLNIGVVEDEDGQIHSLIFRIDEKPYSELEDKALGARVSKWVLPPLRAAYASSTTAAARPGLGRGSRR